MKWYNKQNYINLSEGFHLGVRKVKKNRWPLGWMKFAVNVVRLSWLKCNVAWRAQAVPLDWKTGTVPMFKERDQRLCSSYR